MLGASLMWLSRMRGRCLWRLLWRRRFRGSRSRWRSLCGFVMRRLLLLIGLSRLRRMLIPRLLVLRIRLWLRSRLTGWRRSRRRRMLLGPHLRLLVRRRMLLRLRLPLAIRRRLRVSVPTMLVWLGMPRPPRLRLPLGPRRMRRRLRLMPPGRPLRRRRLPRMLPGRRLRLPVTHRRRGRMRTAPSSTRTTSGCRRRLRRGRRAPPPR